MYTSTSTINTGGGCTNQNAKRGVGETEKMEIHLEIGTLIGFVLLTVHDS